MMSLRNNITYIAFFMLLAASGGALAQGKQVSSQHQQWYAFFGTADISQKSSLYTDLHYVEPAFVIGRLGYTYKFTKNVTGAVGHAYGKFVVPGAATDDFDRTEHRPWAQLQLQTPLLPTVTLSHRLRYELRILQDAEAGELKSSYTSSSRFRLQESLRINFPRLAVQQVSPYVVVSEEYFMNVKDSHTNHVFDQNRFAVMLGAQYHKTRLQAGYMNRYVQRNIAADSFVNNHTLVVWLFQNLDLRKQPEKPAL